MRTRPATRKLLSLLALLSFAGTATACGEEGSTDPDITGTTIPVTEAPESEDTGGSTADDSATETEDPATDDGGSEATG